MLLKMDRSEEAGLVTTIWQRGPATS